MSAHRRPSAAARPGLPVVGVLRVVTGVTAVLLVAGCGGAAAPGAAPDATSTTDVAPEPSASPAESTSGSLTKDSLPDPKSLGSRWQYRVEAGGAEEGFTGNGTPALARDPREVVMVLTPLGCRPVRLPVPTSALEVTYAHARGTPAVGLLLEFADAGAAAKFFNTRAEAMRDCVSWSKAQAEVTVLRDTGTSFVSVRAEDVGDTPVWTEGVRRSGARVLFVAVEGGGADSRASVERALGQS